jgi:hypothetical protein
MEDIELSGDIRVEVCDALPLTADEKTALLPGLEESGLSPCLLDIIANIPQRTRLVKAYAADGGLLGLTSILLTPGIFMKHCYGYGNHIGTNSPFLFTRGADRAQVLAAIFRKLLQMRPGGHYVGFIDPALSRDFEAALEEVPNIIADRIMESGSISTLDPDIERVMLSRHSHLSRQLHRFRNKGGSVHVLEGPPEAALAEAFVACCLDSYRKNTHPGMAIDVDAYAGHVRDFMRSTPGAVYIYARLGDQVVGVQIFLRHQRHLELTEGGFFSQTYHAYENIIMASLRYAVDNGLEKVSYGLILNPNKERLLDADTRVPVYLVMFFKETPPPQAKAQMRAQAHERFPMLVWKERGQSGQTVPGELEAVPC